MSIGSMIGVQGYQICPEIMKDSAGRGRGLADNNCCEIATPVAHLQHLFGTAYSRDLFVRSQYLVGGEDCI